MTGRSTEWLAIREAAVLVGASPWKIRRWVAAGLLPAYRSLAIVARHGQLLLRREDVVQLAAPLRGVSPRWRRPDAGRFRKSPRPPAAGGGEPALPGEHPDSRAGPRSPAHKNFCASMKKNFCKPPDRLDQSIEETAMRNK